MRLLVLVLLAVAGGACSPPPLANTQPSADALAREVLAALHRRDEARLRRIALDADEFERHVWASLPAARPERNMPWTYVWSDLQQKSDAHLKRTLAHFGGKPLALESIRFGGDTTRYASYIVHRSATLVVRDASGALHEVRVFGSGIEQQGRWKVFSYVVDD